MAQNFTSIGGTTAASVQLAAPIQETITAIWGRESGALSPNNNVKESSGWSGGSYADRVKSTFESSSGSAARFFYTAKASKSERNHGLGGMVVKERTTQGRDIVRTIDRRDGKGRVPVNAQIRPRANNHPTVKPLALMRYLCRLSKTPSGGIILDPFMGGGTTIIEAGLFCNVHCKF